MDPADGSQGAPALAAQEELLAILRGAWPFPKDVHAGELSISNDSRAFIAGATNLQNQGLIMYEALLVGTGAQPCIRDAVITYKGLREGV